MSATDLQPHPSNSVSTPELARRGAGASARWGRIALVCTVLIASGFVRSRQAERIKDELEKGVYSFPLTAIPAVMGPWKGEETEIDPRIARGTGARQVVTRRYVNQQTGVALDVIVLFGQAVDMYIHTPELCYPAAGYALAGGPDARTIPLEAGAAPFRALLYSKGEGAASDLQEVYYSWRYNGQWTPQVGLQKHFERIAGMYKVHLARRVTEHERRDFRNPCEGFLQWLLPEIERRIAGDGG